PAPPLTAARYGTATARRAARRSGPPSPPTSPPGGRLGHPRPWPGGSPHRTDLDPVLVAAGPGGLGLIDLHRTPVLVAGASIARITMLAGDGGARVRRARAARPRGRGLAGRAGCATSRSPRRPRADARARHEPPGSAGLVVAAVPPCRRRAAG